MLLEFWILNALLRVLCCLTLKPAKLFWEARHDKMAIPSKAASPFHPITTHF